MVTSPPSPLGVSLRYFHHLLDACGGRKKLNGRTTAQVCFDHIVPLTKSTELSLVDHIANDATTRHIVYLFLETVDSLDTFFAGQGLADEAVLWFCVFNNNQHLAHSYPFEYWSTTFKSQLVAIGNVVMIMYPWDDPIVLHLLIQDMLRPTALKDVLGTIMSEASETTVASDGIVELIRTETSFTASINALKQDAEIRDLCRKTYFGPAHWVMISATSRLGGASYGLGDFDAAAFCPCATIYNVQGKFRASRAVFSENLAALERTHGALHAHAIIALSNIAIDDVALGHWKRAQAILLVAASRSQRQPLPPAYAFFLFKYYLETAQALCREAFPADDPLTTNAVTSPFLLDPTDNELASEAWPEEVCRACYRQPTGRIYESFCDHGTDVFLSYVPPHRYLMEQDMLQSTPEAAATVLWQAYAAYCAQNNLPDEGQARYASFEPIDTRSWHPMR
ncbi:hypothetical protein SPRG_15674 [Saprolegnia parasitica CBS 223.65]|uniref:Uncharacterized protein n=1 Tax=Saprolegnia parasitica (strain CBS 223.65) TaxID=695850 RepID=A0A067BIA7_SAPPC|nr:hypothetical protein SPRG_15674 [Saprolegnia parasitica CBS 223.65]KDO17898.1 hypothetical protein SPRG_15674 [Saprolegnia parasitica CBS 223.65]|eukprot:XP_012211395.1 hypothetical protein SPRG_15674 [Saprolegnia parasitica CBS 223.65]